MASIPPPPYMKLSCYMGGDQKTWSNVYWYVPNGAQPANFNPKDVSDAMAAAWGPIYQGILTLGVRFYGVSAEINFGFGTFGAKSYTPLNGTVSGAVMPEDVAAVVQTYTASGGRSKRGRKYYSEVPQQFVDGSYVNAVGQAAYALVIGQLVSTMAITGVNYEPNVFSQKNGSQEKITGANLVWDTGTIRSRRAVF